MCAVVQMASVATERHRGAFKRAYPRCFPVDDDDWEAGADSYFDALVGSEDLFVYESASDPELYFLSLSPADDGGATATFVLENVCRSEFGTGRPSAREGGSPLSALLDFAISKKGPSTVYLATAEGRRKLYSDMGFAEVPDVGEGLAERLNLEEGELVMARAANIAGGARADWAIPAVAVVTGVSGILLAACLMPV